MRIGKSIHRLVATNEREEIIRGRFDKCLASPPEGATIAREICYRVVHSRRYFSSKFQLNRTRIFILTARGNGRVCGFYKNGKRAMSVDDSILVF